MAYDLFARCGGVGLSFGGMDTGADSSDYQVDTDWVYGTAGDKCVYVRFISPVTQVSTTLTLYMYATGPLVNTPKYKAELRNGPSVGGDEDLPEAAGAALDTTADVVPEDGKWATFAFAAASLVAGNSYFIVIYNSDTGNEATDYTLWRYRGSLDSFCSDGSAIHNSGVRFLQSGYTSDGFSGAAPTAANPGCGVIKFSDGTLLGNPYIEQETHASNTNDRGMQFTFPYPVRLVSACVFAAGTANISGFKVTDTGGTVLGGLTFAETRTLEINGSIRLPATEIAANQTFRILLTYSVNSTAGVIYTMGDTEANLAGTDVLACRAPGMAYVDNVTADTSKMGQFFIGIEPMNEGPLVGGGHLLGG